MSKTNFILYKDSKSVVDLLNNEQAGILFKGIYQYVEDRTELDTNDGMIKVAFAMIKAQLERDLEKYKKTVARNQENGKKGGRPSNKAPKTHSVNNNPLKASGNNNNPLKAKKADSVSDSVNDSDSVRDNDKKRYYENTVLNDLFMEFLKIRKKLKAVNSERAINIQLNTLNKYEDDIKIKMLENAISNSWKSVYELKEQNTYKQKNDEPEWINEKIANLDKPKEIKHPPIYLKHVKLYCEHNGGNWETVSGEFDRYEEIYNYLNERGLY